MPGVRRRTGELLTQAQALGWRLTGEGRRTVSFAVPGPGAEATLTVTFFEDSQGTPDRIALWSGPPRLDALLLAITDVRDPSRRWLSFLLEGVALQLEGRRPPRKAPRSRGPSLAVCLRRRSMTTPWDSVRGRGRGDPQIRQDRRGDRSRPAIQSTPAARTGG